MTDHKLNHKDCLEFIFGGNSTFTCKNPKTDNRYTFKVKKHKVDDIYFVNVLTNKEYSFIGTVYKNTNYRHSAKSKIGTQATSVKTFDYIINHLRAGNLPEFIEIWHSGSCGRCGRKLTVPASIESGFGPECVKLK
jgi:hypothetical protein